jgi:Zn-finger nucleic acid-binding protein
MSTHGVTVSACGHCGGLWIDHASAGRIAHAAIDGATAVPADPMACPICRSALRAWNARGITIDRCDAHGLWFDHTELDRVVAMARDGAGSTAAIAAGGVVAAGTVAAAAVSSAPAAQGRPDAIGTGIDVADVVAESASVVVDVVDVVPDGILGTIGGAVGAIFDFFS